MVSYLSQKDYLAYFDAVQAFTTVTLHGIENVTLKDQAFIPINRYSWIHSHLLGIGRVIGAVFSKSKRLNRQKETDQKVARLTDHIRVICDTNKRLVSLVKKGDTATSLIATNYYTLRASKLHQEALQEFTKWNKQIENKTQKSKSLKNRLQRFVGFAITSLPNLLTIVNTPKGTLVEIPHTSFFKFSSQPFAAICRSYRGFSNPKRGLSLINHSRLQIIGGMSPEAVKKADEILKKEKLKDPEKTAFKNASSTAADAMAVEEYMEALVLNTFRSGHDQLEISEGILHFETQVGQALTEFFKKTESFDLIFPLFQSAKYHFCHNQSSKMQAIHVLMSGVLKTYMANHFNQLKETDLEKWLDESLKLFPEEAPWIKALFFEEVVRAYVANASTQKENMRIFASKHLVCDQLSLEYITRKLT